MFVLGVSSLETVRRISCRMWRSQRARRFADGLSYEPCNAIIRLPHSRFCTQRLSRSVICGRANARQICGKFCFEDWTWLNCVLAVMLVVHIFHRLAAACLLPKTQSGIYCFLVGFS